MRFKPAGKDTAVQPISIIDNWEEGLGYFEEPFAVRGKEELAIDIRVDTVPGVAAEPLQFLGFAVKLMTKARLQQVDV